MALLVGMLWRCCRIPLQVPDTVPIMAFGTLDTWLAKVPGVQAPFEVDPQMDLPIVLAFIAVKYLGP